jgi:hypothetical protein
MRLAATIRRRTEELHRPRDQESTRPSAGPVSNTKVYVYGAMQREHAAPVSRGARTGAAAAVYWSANEAGS